MIELKISIVIMTLVMTTIIKYIDCNKESFWRRINKYNPNDNEDDHNDTYDYDGHNNDNINNDNNNINDDL